MISTINTQSLQWVSSTKVHKLPRFKTFKIYCLLKNFAKLGDKSERYRLCLFTGFQTKGNFSDGRFSVKFDDTNNTTELTVTDLRSSDEGEYSCAEFQHDGETQKWDLQVYGEIMDQLLVFLRRFHLVVS